MSTRSLAVTEQIRSAMASNNPDDIVNGVKQAVAQEVTSLSPDANVVLTNYFNHTYMPDLVVEWNDAGKRDERPIFLRNDLRPEATERDVRSLARQEPVVLSLTALDEPSVASSPLREQAREANRVLVTDVVSLADMATPFDTQRSTSRGREEAPLLRLVQANLLKGGRGLLTPHDIERLAQSATPPETGTALTEQFLATFQETADEMFAPDASLRLRRSAELLRLGLGLSTDIIDSIAGGSGELSEVELRVLIPYLLVDETARANTRLWHYIGSMMSLERLEELGNALAEMDVTPLVVPNLETWTGKRAQLVLNNSYDEDSNVAISASMLRTADFEMEDESELAGLNRGDSFWSINNRLLTADAGPWRLFIASDARRLKGRTASAAANWDDISPLISEFALDSVDLRGLSRRIYVGAEGSGDVSSDVVRIRSSIDDSYQVTKVHVRRPDDDEKLGNLNVDFTEMTVTAGRGGASIASLVRAAELLAHSQPSDFSALTAAQALPLTGATDPESESA
ncbi:hypothetical protein [Actinoplanes sp. NBRC 103695]|uniref:hypothetical protein n=1 Tax=Actinoplanes sp. NBRC 103695 TaxID=3032202 RepID=UPI0024A16565|nr:hypothetical protein [Actinoplanes sp. NBRC 103695]GLY97442.1 hypothetical protein Acsp02_46960 [Actinoplanes sp. NBRC 103695]